jgi:protein phosphatase
LQSGDQLLLCSDGLWSSVREHELAYRLSVGPLEQSVPALVRQAAQVGGKTGDNVTALAVTWLDDLHDPGESPLMTDALPHDRVITNIHPSGI